MKEIKPLRGDLSEAIKRVIKLQEESLEKLESGIIIGIPKEYFSFHYCESSGLRCDKQCKYCKDEK
jgi:hypothetical protein